MPATSSSPPTEAPARPRLPPVGRQAGVGIPAMRSAAIRRQRGRQRQHRRAGGRVPDRPAPWHAGSRQDRQSGTRQRRQRLDRDGQRSQALRPVCDAPPAPGAVTRCATKSSAARGPAGTATAMCQPRQGRTSAVSAAEPRFSAAPSSPAEQTSRANRHRTFMHPEGGTPFRPSAAASRPRPGNRTTKGIADRQPLGGRHSRWRRHRLPDPMPSGRPDPAMRHCGRRLRQGKRANRA